MTVNLATGLGSGGDAEGDRLYSIEVLEGSQDSSFRDIKISCPEKSAKKTPCKAGALADYYERTGHPGAAEFYRQLAARRSQPNR